jgi:c(7)-type cytochrome triheme protein
MSRAQASAIQKLGGAIALAAVAAVAMLVSAGGSSFAAQGDPEPAVKSKSSKELRFGHALHKEKGVAIDSCDTCHGIKGVSVEPVTRGKNHQPCNDAACHASEYMSKEPTICVVCHESNDPWVKQTARIRNLSSSEFGGEISHKTHQSDKASKGGVKCDSCHGNVYERGDKPDAHAVCGSCHQGGMEPNMNDCGSCHKLGYQASQRKGASKYSVRARFDHSDHDRDPRSKGGPAPDCKTCHVGLEKATTLAEVIPPTMRSCDSCHDGKLAFKTTGFGCVKCHGGAN